MLNYKNILVPYDGSDHARKALEHAIDLAQCSKECKMYIATIFSKAKALKHSEEKSVEELRQIAKDELEKAAAKVPETVKKKRFSWKANQDRNFSCWLKNIIATL